MCVSGTVVLINIYNKDLSNKIIQVKVVVLLTFIAARLCPVYLLCVVCVIAWGLVKGNFALLANQSGLSPQFLSCTHAAAPSRSMPGPSRWDLHQAVLGNTT